MHYPHAPLSDYIALSWHLCVSFCYHAQLPMLRQIGHVCVFFLEAIVRDACPIALLEGQFGCIRTISQISQIYFSGSCFSPYCHHLLTCCVIVDMLFDLGGSQWWLLWLCHLGDSLPEVTAWGTALGTTKGGQRRACSPRVSPRQKQR